MQVAKGNSNYDEIDADIFEVVKTYWLGRDGFPIYFKRYDLSI